jgi:hypothetical protein
MDSIIRDEFGLSRYEYKCLLRTLREKLGVKTIEDIAFVSAEQFATITDYWENAAVKRLFTLVTTHIGVEKLWRCGDRVDVADDDTMGTCDFDVD